MEAARWRCECTGQCGRRHKTAGDGRCHHTDTPHTPALHAITREKATLHHALALPATAHMAACTSCHTLIARTRNHPTPSTDEALTLF
jgi:hypothetical protein